jgi:hypothetical protein
LVGASRGRCGVDAAIDDEWIDVGIGVGSRLADRT